MFNHNDKQKIKNNSQAIVYLSDLVGQLIDCLAKHGIKFEYVKGKLLDEKKDS